MKVNCWEAKQCGRQKGGGKVREKGFCPAAAEERLNGIHGGKNAGRSCWVVAGTLCQGEVQGSFAKKFENCEKCDFYLQVQKEEFPAFVYSSVLLAKLKK